ncbi:MAG: ABC transporter permease [Solirubrobacteraceae bacterium]|nr:ABC transporter permease [Solirubrobacteraceae bacterium]
MFIEDVFSGAVRYGSSVIFATQGEVISERAGVINLGMEGSMLCGALAAFATASATGSAVLGIFAGVAAGAVLAALHAFLVLWRGANQLASGLAISFLGLGLTAALGVSFVSKQITGLGAIEIPVLSDIPIIGPGLFAQDILTYLALILPFILVFLLARTRWGLVLRATGERPEVARAYGYDPRRVRAVATTIGGALGGLGGSQLVLAYTLNWVENVTVGRGFVAVALVIFGAWKPVQAAIGGLVFGAALSLQLQLQARGVDVSIWLLQMTPYVLTLLVLTITSRRQSQQIPEGLKAVFGGGKAA